MKKLFVLLAASAAFTGTILAGQPIKTVVPPEELYGLGWYGALQGGVNAYTDLGGGKDFHTGGGRVTLSPHADVGGFGGGKIGYVFGTGFVRPALEADMFYNGVDASVTATGPNARSVSANARIDSGAFLANSLLRFNFQKFQPYLGFGLGVWVAEANDAEVKVNNHSRALSTSSDSGLAWQIVAGADYYFNPKLSLFLEYKFLNYADSVLSNTAEQQLVGAGVRFHF